MVREHQRMATWNMSVQRRVMLFIALLSMAPLLRAAAPAEVVRDLAYQIQAAVDARDTTRLAALLSPSSLQSRRKEASPPARISSRILALLQQTRAALGSSENGAAFRSR
jgi:hypothetical protein